ncbi:hypothetical protein AHAS_Ahas05G0172300 [Arachis hypogaea]
MVTLVLPTLFESYGPGQVLECVNGIICHYTQPCPDVIIGLWNPKTDEHKIIPPGITDDESGYDRHKEDVDKASTAYLNGVCHWWGSEFATNGLEEQHFLMDINDCKICPFGSSISVAQEMEDYISLNGLEFDLQVQTYLIHMYPMWK